jgi:hypothetical protein
MAPVLSPDSSPPSSPEPLPAPAVEPLADGLTRLLDDLHAQLADEQLRILERLRLEPADLLALGRLGVPAGGGGAGPEGDAQALARLRARELAEPSGRGRAWLLTPKGRALLDELHEGRARSIHRFVTGLDRGRRLRLAGALHLLSADLEGGAVVGG